MSPIEKYQDDTQQSINDFYNACNALVDCHYLNAVNNIQEILKKIAASKKLYELFGKICNGFDLDKQILQQRQEDGNGLSYLVMPTDPTRCAAFVFRLLMQIDTKESLENFLRENYCNIDFWSQFNGIAKSIIPAFLTATKLLLDNPDKINPVNDTQEQEEEIIEYKQVFIDIEEPTPAYDPVQTPFQPHNQQPYQHSPQFQYVDPQQNQLYPTQTAPMEYNLQPNLQPSQSIPPMPQSNSMYSEEQPTTFSRPQPAELLEDIIMRLSLTIQQTPQLNKEMQNSLVQQIEDLVLAYQTKNQSMIDHHKAIFFNFTHQMGIAHLFTNYITELDNLQLA